MDSEKKENEISETVGEIKQETTNEDIQRFINQHRSNNQAKPASKLSNDNKLDNSVKVHMAHSQESITPDQKAVEDLRNSINNARNKFMADLGREQEPEIVATPVAMNASLSTNRKISSLQSTIYNSYSEEDEEEDAIEEFDDTEEENTEDNADDSSEDQNDDENIEKKKNSENKSNKDKNNPENKDQMKGNSKKTSGEEKKNSKENASEGKNKKTQNNKAKEKKKKDDKKNKLGKKRKQNWLWELIKKFPWQSLIVCLVLLLIIIIIGIIMAFAAGGGAILSCTYLDPMYDYNKTVINLMDPNDSSVTIDSLLLKDLATYATYADLHDKVADLDDTQKYNLYTAYLLVIKSRILYLSEYNYEIKSGNINNGDTGIKYCDIYNGCKIYEQNEKTTYISNVSNITPAGSLLETIPAMPESDLNLLLKAVDEIEYKILVGETLTEPLTKYTYSISAISPEIIEQWITLSKTNAIYLEFVQNIAEYNGYQFYDIKDYAPVLRCSSNSLYWWPIGSAEPDEYGLYSGTPTNLNVGSYFGPRDIDGDGQMTQHNGVDIGAVVNGDIIIAARGGTVRDTKDGCPTYGYYGSSCNGQRGNYVIITHDDGSETKYFHMAEGSIVVKTGDTVSQGQKLGMAGSSGSSTGGHLHFGLYIDGKPVDPLEYISADDPRPAIGVNIKFTQGANTKETVCKTLLASNFSENATIALMINIEAESSFNVGADGDNGTSYGLCQWHNGRKYNLKQFCKELYNTEACQLDYLMEELINGSYKSVYQTLLSGASASDMAVYFCKNFEIPANYNTTCPNRVSSRISAMEAYVKNGCQ